MIFDSVTALVLSWILIGMLANCYFLGDVSEEAFSQVDNDAIVEVAKENSRRRYGDGNDDGLTGEAPLDTMNVIRLLLANEEDKIITHTINRMTPRKTRTNGVGAIFSRQKRHPQRKYKDSGEGEYSYRGKVWAESGFGSASNYAKVYQNPRLKKKTVAKKRKNAAVRMAVVTATKRKTESKTRPQKAREF